MQGNIFKIRKHKVEEWKKWASYLISQKKLVAETLEEENVSLEGSFLFSQGEDTLVCLYSVEKNDVNKKEANLEKEINVKHREKMKECFEEKISKIENLYLFESSN